MSQKHQLFEQVLQDAPVCLGEHIFTAETLKPGETVVETVVEIAVKIVGKRILWKETWILKPVLEAVRIVPRKRAIASRTKPPKGIVRIEGVIGVWEVPVVGREKSVGVYRVGWEGGLKLVGVVRVDDGSGALHLVQGPGLVPHDVVVLALAASARKDVCFEQSAHTGHDSIQIPSLFSFVLEVVKFPLSIYEGASSVWSCVPDVSPVGIRAAIVPQKRTVRWGG